MDLTTCRLYGIKRKRDLYLLLNIFGKKEMKEIINSYSPYIANKTKKRLIEPSTSEKLKKVQKKIQVLLKEIVFDNNIFSGISGKSYIDNGKYHIGCKYVVALDISKFFPNTSRDKVYKFFKYQLLNSSDVAKILTDLCTIDINNIANIDDNVKKYMSENNIKYSKHLPTGSPISCILSYLVNLDMFYQITTLCNNVGCKMTVYVDDIIISSNTRINKQLINKVKTIIEQNNYKVQKRKVKRYDNNEFKRITGNILNKDGSKLIIPNKISYKIYKLKNNSKIDIDKKQNKLGGYNQVLKQIEKANIN